MERFYIEKSLAEPLQWACIDRRSGLTCIFEDGNFYGKTVFTFAGEKLPDYRTRKEIEKDMNDWLLKNHSDKLAT